MQHETTLGLAVPPPRCVMDRRRSTQRQGDHQVRAVVPQGLGPDGEHLFSVEEASDVLFRPWIDAVYKAVKEVRINEWRVVRCVQVSQEWRETYPDVTLIWGLPIEVDIHLFGLGFRVVA